MIFRQWSLSSIGIALLIAITWSTQSFAQTTRNYIIKLRDEPVVSHMRRLRPASRNAMEINGTDASAYRSQLFAKQDALRRLVGTMREARVEAQTDTVFNGLVVSLRPQDVSALLQNPGVEDVVPSIYYHKILDAALPLVNVPQAWTNVNVGGEGRAGAGIRIGIIDTGIDNSHPMFQDSSLTPPSGFPRFTASTLQCSNSDQQFTNSKVIVSRNYVSLLASPDKNCDAEDRDGHGTFVAAIAAGRRVMAPFASISGVAPKAFLGSYKVFGTPGTNDQATLGAILKAIDDAVKDGMNVINLSLGTEAVSLPGADPLDIAVANATAAGVTVVVAAGNDGPATGTVTSPGTSPAAITVGASTNSRILANPLLITANVPVPQILQRIGAVPGNGPKLSVNVGSASLVDVSSLGNNLTACSPLPTGSLSGKLALIQRGTCGFSVKILNASNAGALAAIVYNNQTNQPAIAMDVGSSTSIPSAMIGNAEGTALAQLLAIPGVSIQATIRSQLMAVSVTSDQIASFSSDGPSNDLGIKPDIVAPGTNIYSAAQRNFAGGEQYDPTGFTISNGTSFSTPFVAGAAALVKQAYPGFTPVQIKSVLVNTAARNVLNLNGNPADVLTDGNGLLDAAAALNSTVTVSPVSLSYGLLKRGTISFDQKNLNVTNVGSSSSSFTVSVVPSVDSAQFNLSVSPSTFVLGPGSSTVLSVSANLAAPAGTVTGSIVIQNQASQTGISIPYWGTFLQPTISPGGVVNAASLISGPASFAPGEIISIFGNDMVNSIDSAVTLPLPLSLGGVTLKIGGQAAPLLYVSPNQINAQIPFELDGRTSADLVISLNGSTSPSATIPLTLAAPGIFTDSQQGTGRGAVLHAADSTPVTPSNPARRGEFLEIFLTGLGTASPGVATGNPASFPPPSITKTQPSVTIGGLPARMTFSGLTPGFVGLNQINIQVPDGVPPGEQMLIVTSNGVASNPVTLSIGP